MSSTSGQPGRARRRDFARSIPTLVVGAATTLGFALYLELSGALSGFIGYFEDVATAHSLTGGVPLFVNYARAGTPDALGVLHFSTAEGPTISRYPIELVLPLVCILATVFLISCRVRSGQRLTVEDFLTIGAAGLVLLYYPKGISRGDSSHIGEVFAVTVPLVMLLAYRAIEGLDVLARWTRSRRARPDARPSHATPPRALAATWHRGQRLRAPVAPASVVALLVVIVLAPTSPTTLLSAAISHFRATSPTPATPPAAPGDPSLGFATATALPPHLLDDVNAILTAEAGRTGAVFDLSDAPGLVEFLLDHRPGTRLYDISIAITPTAQRQVISDLQRSRPRVVLFAGVVGLSYWDFIENEVRQYLVANYVLAHYRPLVAVDGELILLADSVKTAAPLPRLLGKASTGALYFSQAVCGFGYIPNFLASPGAPAGAISVPLVRVPAMGTGRLYKLTLPANRHLLQWFALTRRGGRGPASVTLGNVFRRSGKAIPWHDITWVAATPGTTSVSVGSCLQWHGYGPTLYLRYTGPGTPVSIRLF